MCRIKSNNRKLSIQLSDASFAIKQRRNVYHFTINRSVFIPLDIKRKYPLSADLKIISFEYMCSDRIDRLGISIDGHVLYVRNIDPVERWHSVSVDISRYKSLLDRTILRRSMNCLGITIIPFPTSPAISFKIKDIRLRPFNQVEREKEDTEADCKAVKVLPAINLENYLYCSDFPCSITKVSLDSSRIQIEGSVLDDGSDIYVCEIPMYGNLSQQNIMSVTKLSSSDNRFCITTERFRNIGNTVYDRLYSRWALGVKTEDGMALCSLGRYTDELQSEYDIPHISFRNKKGLSGFVSNAYENDLDELNITYVDLDICLNDFIRLDSSSYTVPFEYNGQMYYADMEQLEKYDAALLSALKRNIDVSAIISVYPECKSPDKEVGRLLEYPTYERAGIYTFPNITTLESLNLYAAAIDFLASRYSRPDKKYGHIHRWIVHRLADMGWIWANAGEKNVREYMDLYHKSMRLIYYTTLKYNGNTEVLISLSHFWTGQHNEGCCYSPSRMLDILKRYSQSEGDFRWGIAYHLFPVIRWNSKMRNEKEFTFSEGTRHITCHNLDVLDTWIKRADTFYEGKKRTLFLAGYNPNSVDNSKHAQAEQAAGLTYVWNKVTVFEGIDAYLANRWIDARFDGGLKTGLRKYPDDQNDPFGPKLSWYVYRDLGTDKEDVCLQTLKQTVGISNREEIFASPEKK